MPPVAGRQFDSVPSMTEQPDNERFRKLMREAEGGSEEAARELYETYVKYVLRCVRHRMWHRLRSKFDSQDFVQQVWASFFDGRGSLPRFETPDDLIAYLRSMAEKKVASEGRQRRLPKRNLVLEVAVHEDSDTVGQHPATRLPTPSAVAVFNEQFDRLVEQQTDETKAVAQLRYEGNTFEEISQCLNVDESSARKVMRRLKRRATSDDPPQSSTSLQR
jgi:RNA polymerase sigma factor (sigma-70 family)